MVPTSNRLSNRRNAHLHFRNLYESPCACAKKKGFLSLNISKHVLKNKFCVKKISVVVVERLEGVPNRVVAMLCSYGCVPWAI